MDKPIKLLIVEDSAEDAELIAFELKQQGFHPKYECVDTAATLMEALARQGWDAVLSDHSMPGFGAMAALAICKNYGLDIPFICVSGKIGEDEAVALMRAGAHDYVKKDHLSSLGAKVERELHAAQQRAELRLQEFMKAHLAAIVKHSDDAIIGTNLDGIVLSWNRGAEIIYGYPAEEMIGQSLSILHPPECAGELANNLELLRKGESVGRHETLRLRKDGTVINVSLTVSPIKGGFGQITGVSVIVRDITERCREQQELLKLNTELKETLGHLKTLSGLLPICASCKKIRDDQGYWQQVEAYIEKHSEVEFTHGVCPDCAKVLYPDLDLSGSDSNHLPRLFPTDGK